MNCVKHSSESAVAQCQQCNMGMCAQCVENRQKMLSGKTLCNACAMESIKNAIGECKGLIKQDMKKLIILSVLLAIGLFCLAYIKFTTFENADPIIQAIIYLLISWGIGAKMLSAPATDADQIQTTLWLSSSNQSVAGGALIGIIIGLVLRCFLFPIFYLIFAFNVLNGRKKLLAHINEQESLLANLQNA